MNTNQYRKSGRGIGSLWIQMLFISLLALVSADSAYSYYCQQHKSDSCECQSRTQRRTTEVMTGLHTTLSTMSQEPSTFDSDTTTSSSSTEGTTLSTSDFSMVNAPGSDLLSGSSFAHLSLGQTYEVVPSPGQPLSSGGGSPPMGAGIPPRGQSYSLQLPQHGPQGRGRPPMTFSHESGATQQPSGMLTDLGRSSIWSQLQTLMSQIERLRQKRDESKSQNGGTMGDEQYQMLSETEWQETGFGSFERFRAVTQGWTEVEKMRSSSFQRAYHLLEKKLKSIFCENPAPTHRKVEM